MKLVGIELGFNSNMLCSYFFGVDFIQKEVFEPDTPVFTQVISKTFSSIMLERLQSLKKCFLPYSNNDYIEEIRLREVLKSSIPSLTNENISLIINSLSFTIPASKDIPFRQIKISEFMSIFDNSDFSVIKIENPIKVPNVNIIPSNPIVNTETSPICETFIVKPRDYNWEKRVISKVYRVHGPLLANFRLSDFNKSGSLTLEVFHYTLRKSMEWLSDEEIYFLVDLGIREAGCIDTKRTEDVLKNYSQYSESKSISYAWFPSGEQYNISYTYFVLVLEKLSN